MKLIGAVVCVAFGVWLTQNHPDTANQVLAYVIYGFNYLIAFVQSLLAVKG
ncbi:hypothetical protein [Acinetobacter johnsonii]|uniref:Uncharacterized protein n=1 Tax=Citrobacter freundii TaxID=546 RepID=A0A2I7QF76_CITFR|nr:hypothetical protein [Acinetobacter johnsonii]AUR79975.1 hypothetical protein pCf587_0196 [Citrobacter freundii]